MTESSVYLRGRFAILGQAPQMSVSLRQQVAAEISQSHLSILFPFNHCKQKSCYPVFFPCHSLVSIFLQFKKSYRDN